MKLIISPIRSTTEQQHVFKPKPARSIFQNIHTGIGSGQIIVRPQDFKMDFGDVGLWIEFIPQSCVGRIDREGSACCRGATSPCPG